MLGAMEISGKTMVSVVLIVRSKGIVEV